MKGKSCLLKFSDNFFFKDMKERLKLVAAIGLTFATVGTWSIGGREISPVEIAAAAQGSTATETEPRPTLGPTPAERLYLAYIERGQLRGEDTPTPPAGTVRPPTPTGRPPTPTSRPPTPTKLPTRPPTPTPPTPIPRPPMPTP